MDQIKLFQKRLEKSKELKLLLEEHGSLANVANHLGVSRQAVWNKCKNWGLDYEEYKHSKKKKSEEYKKVAVQVAELTILKNFSIQQAQKEIGNSWNLLRDFGMSDEIKKLFSEYMQKMWAGNLRTIRMLKGMTQKELEDKSGIRQVHISNLELNRCHASNKRYQKLADAMGVDRSAVLNPMTYETVVKCASRGNHDGT